MSLRCTSKDLNSCLSFFIETKSSQKPKSWQMNYFLPYSNNFPKNSTKNSQRIPKILKISNSLHIFGLVFVKLTIYFILILSELTYSGWNLGEILDNMDIRNCKIERKIIHKRSGQFFRVFDILLSLVDNLPINVKQFLTITPFPFSTYFMDDPNYNCV